MARPQIRISLLSFAQTHRWSFGQRFVTALAEADPGLMPARAGHVEGSTAAINGLEDLRRWWVVQGLPDEYDGTPTTAYDFLWKTGAPTQSLALVTHGLRDMRGGLSPSSFNYCAAWKRDTDFEGLFGQWVEMSRPALAMLHLFTPPEQLFDIESTVGEFDDFRQDWTSFQAGSYGYLLDPTIPNIGWAMVFAGSYAGQVDVEGLRRAGFPVEPAGDGWLVRVTERLSDVEDDFPRFSARRAELRGFFPDDLFLIKDEPR